MPDEYGGIAVEEPQVDEFGGHALEPDTTKRNVFGESIQDLERKMREARAERIGGEALQGLATGAEAGADILRRLPGAPFEAAEALGVRPIVPPEHVKQIREFVSDAIDRTIPKAEAKADVPQLDIGLTPEMGNQIKKGLEQSFDENVSSLTHPVALAGIAAGVKAPVPVARTFQIQAITQIPQAIQAVDAASKSGDVSGVAKAVGNLGATLAIPAAIEKGLQTPKPTERTANASEIKTPAEVHGDVQPQPVEGEGKVPVQESSPGVQPSSETKIGEVLLEKPAVPSAKEIGAMAPEEFDKFWNSIQQPGDKPVPEGELSRNIQARNDLADSLQTTAQVREAEELANAARDRVKKLNDEALKENNPDKAMAAMRENSRVQFLDEASRLAKARDAVAGGLSVEDAAVNMGVAETPLRKLIEKQQTTDEAGQKIAKELGLKFRGTTKASPSRPNPTWKFEETKPGGEAGMTVSVKAGATPEEVRAAHKSAVEKYIQKGKQAEPVPAGAPEQPKWTTATAEDESGRLYLNPVGPLLKQTVSDIRDLGRNALPWVKKAADFVMDAGKAAAEVGKEGFSATGKAGDYRMAVRNWSAKLQRSFGEAAAAQKDIMKRVPDSIRREAITNWIQAGGDPVVLDNRAAATNDKYLKQGYEAAKNLTPDELAVANDVKAAFDTLGQRGKKYDILNSFLDNYVTQSWNMKKGPTGGASSRTLKDRFRFSKARTFESYFEGEQAGFEPKTKDIAKLLPMYLHEMNSVIAARQLVQQMSRGVASDGRPLVAPRGSGTTVTDPGTGDTATLITPKTVKQGTQDYRVMADQPALNDWRWAAKDEAGNPVFLKADLAVHPEAYGRLKAALGRSAIKEWYSSKTSAAAEIPKALVKLVDFTSREGKNLMFGVLSPFHQVQEAWHGIGHTTNPAFSIPKIDLVNNRAQMDAARHGLMMLPDRASADQFMEGFRQSGLIGKIPVFGRAANAYQDYLFTSYIPGLKFKTYERILDRNTKRYSKELASGAVEPRDLKILSAEQANAAYGHLNYADLARNPTIQHIMQIGLVAPDFFESRARFAGQALKGLTGAKVGREQIMALATLALVQATGAWTVAQLSGGQWDAKRPFEFVKGNRRYTLRSVPEDIQNALRDPRQFVYSRLNPFAGRPAVEELSGVDWKGSKMTQGDIAKEYGKSAVPMMGRGFLGVGNTNLSAWEQLLNAVGIRISRYNPKENQIKHFRELKDLGERTHTELRKLPKAQRFKQAQEKLKDLPPEDKARVLQQLARSGTFTYE